MPSTYAHYRFGQKVLANCPDDLAEELFQEGAKPIFDTALQGPDIFFYDHPVSRQRDGGPGTRIHRMPARCALQIFRDGGGGRPPSREERAYAAGFVCHFALDAACHPYIEAVTNAGIAGHSWVEGEWERYLLVKDGFNPVREKVIEGRFWPNRRCAEAAARMYPEAGREKVLAAMRKMRTIHRLLYAPTAGKRALCAGVLRAAGQYEALGGHIIRPDPYPGLDACDEKLLELAEAAESRAPALIENAFGFLEGKETLLPDFDRTFGAGPDWQKIQI